MKRLKNTKKSHINFENIHIEDYKDYIEIYNFENWKNCISGEVKIAIKIRKMIFFFLPINEYTKVNNLLFKNIDNIGSFDSII